MRVLRKLLVYSLATFNYNIWIEYENLTEITIYTYLKKKRKRKKLLKKGVKKN